MATNPSSCPACGGKITGEGTLGGLCTACLARAVMNPGRITSSDATVAAPSNPKRIGRYEIEKVLGSGGMGIVYLARQIEPIRRRVALKVIKPGMDTATCISRFNAERQALSKLNHPNIASVFDAGADDMGRPYFVMELVEGTSITDYCDHSRLCIEERVELLVDVCRAVHHAHENGIIHRDLKPSNILVADQDGRPSLKVIDFGIAKALWPQEMNPSYVTLAGQFIGTPCYMSPEQVHGSSDTDRPSDVYSLGVVLYELLTGTTPLDLEEVRNAGIVGIADLFKRTDIVTPSFRIQQFSETHRNRVAEARGTVAQHLLSRIKQDLDWVSLKALEGDPKERYATAEELGEELSQYLQDHPVTAGPRTFSYRVRKFVRRQRHFVFGTAAALILLFSGMGINESWQVKDNNLGSKGDVTGAVQVTATGVGNDAASSETAAVTAAVEDTIGAWLDAEAIDRNKEIIEESILKLSQDFVEDHQVVRAPKERPADGLFETTIRATVKIREIGHALTLAGLGPLGGGSASRSEALSGGERPTGVEKPVHSETQTNPDLRKFLE